MGMNFPNSPVVGSSYTSVEGPVYLYDGVTWNVVGPEGSEIALDWGDIAGKPDTFPPSPHTHVLADLTEGVVTISNTPLPEPLHDGQLWWESDTGNLYIWYDDGVSASWEQIIATVDALNQIPTGTFYSNDTPPARINRMADRIFVADATVNEGKPYGSGTESWLADMGTGTDSMAWLESGASLAVTTSIGMSIVGAARVRPDGADGTAIGVTGYALARNPLGLVGNKVAWAGYFQADRQDNAGHAFGIEIDVTNFSHMSGSTFHPGTGVYYGGGQTPYTTLGPGSGGGRTAGLLLGSGSGPSYAAPGTSFDNNVAVEIVGNGSKWASGLVFKDDALLRATAGAPDYGRHAHAIGLAFDHALEWYEPDHGAVALAIVSQMVTNDAPQELLFTSSGMAHINALSGKRFSFSQYVAGAVNYLSFVPSVTGVNPLISSIYGDDANIGLTLQIKGTGVMRVTSSNGVIAQFSATASAVNNFILTATATGTAPAFSVTGDANLDMRIRGAGTGGIILQDGGSVQKFRVNSTGIGFYATTPIAKPTVTGAKGSNAALGSLLTALANLGLLTDSSSA